MRINTPESSSKRPDIDNRGQRTCASEALRIRSFMFQILHASCRPNDRFPQYCRHGAGAAGLCNVYDVVPLYSYKVSMMAPYLGGGYLMFARADKRSPEILSEDPLRLNPRGVPAFLQPNALYNDFEVGKSLQAVQEVQGSK